MTEKWQETISEKEKQEFEQAVNHPKHYEDIVPNVECIDVTEYFNFNRGNAIKYIWRTGYKDKTKEIEDLSKAAWYINHEIERLKREKEQTKVNWGIS